MAEEIRFNRNHLATQHIIPRIRFTFVHNKQCAHASPHHNQCKVSKTPESIKTNQVQYRVDLHLSEQKNTCALSGIYFIRPSTRSIAEPAFRLSRALAAVACFRPFPLQQARQHHNRKQLMSLPQG